MGFVGGLFFGLFSGATMALALGVTICSIPLVPERREALLKALRSALGVFGDVSESSLADGRCKFRVGIYPFRREVYVGKSEVEVIGSAARARATVSIVELAMREDPARPLETIT
jgi:hypothetical protein